MAMHTQGAPAGAYIRRLHVTIATVLACLAAPVLAADYGLVPLTTLDPGTAAVVRGPNGAGAASGGGKVAGQSGNRRSGLVLDRGGPQVVQGLGEGSYSDVFGLNDLGGLVGVANTATAMRAFVGDRSGGHRELPPLPEDTASSAYAINNAGLAVGFSSGPAGERAVVWSPRGEVSALTGPADVLSRAYSVNQRGDVAGVSGASAARRGIVWSAGSERTVLAPLAGSEASEATWINDSGTTVGFSATAAEQRRATLWPARGAPQDLGTLPGSSASQAFGINNVGVVVGTSASAAGSRAFVWSSTTGMQDLNSLVEAPGLVLTTAVGINNTGMIVAVGHDVEAPHAGEPHEHAHEMPLRIFLLVPNGG
jgi:probable HAF family extracellular repeat protein